MMIGMNQDLSEKNSLQKSIKLEGGYTNHLIRSTVISTIGMVLRPGALEFSLNVFTEFAEFSDKKIKNDHCGAGTQDLLCKRQR